jgi:hypothetical protein
MKSTFILTVLFGATALAQPTLTAFTVSPAAANFPGGQGAAVTSGTTVTFSYAFGGSPPCTNGSNASLCELLDNYNVARQVSTASGTVTATPTATRMYEMLATNASGISNSSAIGNGPGTQFIPVFVGAGNLSVSVSGLEGCVQLSGVWTCPQYGVVKIQVVDDSGPCTNYSATAGCTGPSLDSNKNPTESMQGRILFTGQTSGHTTVADAWFCPEPMCSADNAWAFTYRCMTAETIKWAGYYGNAANYGAISGSFVCQPSGGNVAAPVGAYGSNHQFKTLDGRVVHPLEMTWFGEPVDFGNGISDTLNFNGVQSGFSPNISIGTRFTWAGEVTAGLDIRAINTTFPTQLFNQGCYSNRATGGSLGGIYQCGNGQIYPRLTTAPANTANGQSGASLAAQYEIVRNLNRAGQHVILGGLLPSCNSGSNPEYLEFTNSCDPLQDMNRWAAYTHATKLLLDMLGPYIDSLAIESNDSGGTTFATDYYPTLAGLIHQYPNVMVSSGYGWPGSYGIDMALGPENYYQGATGPALNGPNSIAQDAVMSTQLAAIGAGTPVCRSEGGGAAVDSDHNWNEMWRLEMWMNAFHGNTCASAWPSVYGNDPPQADGSSGNSNLYMGDEEWDQMAKFHSAWWDMDPAATALFGTGSIISTCGKSIFLIGNGSARDVMIHVSNLTDRNTCSGGTFTVTMPAAMQGYWYSTLTGAIVGSLVSVGSGTQTISIPSFGQAANCAYPTSSCLPDHIVLRLRAAITGSPLMAQVMLPGVLVGSAYSQTVSALGCSGSCTYKITTGNFPDGITMNSSGVISGTATIASTRIVGITATDSTSDVSPEQRYWITVYAPVSFDGGASISMWLGTRSSGPKSPRVSVRGGVPPVKCAITSGSFTNTGLSAHPGVNMCLFDGSVSNPTPGTDTVTLTATDAAGNTATQNMTVTTLTFGAFGGVWSTLPGLDVQITQGQWFGGCFALGSGTMTINVTSGSLPPGLTLTAQSSGCNPFEGTAANAYLQGIPTTTGTYSFTMQYTDGSQTSPSYPVTMTVESPITLASATISETANTPFIYNLSVSDGSQYRACHVTGGAVPVGVLFDMSTCTFYGTAAPGNTTATVEAIDPWGSTQTQNIAFSIGSTMTSACDLNQDGMVNALDVQIAINQVLGMSSCTNADLQGNGTCTVVDVERVIIAALGGSCRIGP